MDNAFIARGSWTSKRPAETAPPDGYFAVAKGLLPFATAVLPSATAPWPFAASLA